MENKDVKKSNESICNCKCCGCNGNRCECSHKCNNNVESSICNCHKEKEDN